jgi:hypothetical protein
MTPAEEQLAAMQQLSALLGRQPSTREQQLLGLLGGGQPYTTPFLTHPYLRSVPPATATTFLGSDTQRLLLQQQAALRSYQGPLPPIVSRGTSRPLSSVNLPSSTYSRMQSWDGEPWLVKVMRRQEAAVTAFLKGLLSRLPSIKVVKR